MASLHANLASASPPTTTRPHPGPPITAPSPVACARSPSVGSPSTAASSTAASTSLPTNDEVEAVIKMATSTRPTPDGRPPPGKDTRTQLFAGNLPYRVRWQDLKDLFRRAGTVLRADVSLSPDNRSRGYGTVLLASAEDAGRAVDMFNGYSWQGRVLEVRLDRLGGIAEEMDLAVNPGAGVSAGIGTGVGVGLGLGLSGAQGMSALGAGANVNALNGLHIPAPQTALPFVSQHLSGNGSGAASGATSASLSAALSQSRSSSLASGGSASTLSSSLSTSPPDLHTSGLFAFQQPQQQQQLQQQQHQQHQQHQQQQQEREESIANRLGSTGSLPSFNGFGSGGFGSLSGFGADLEREHSRSISGMRSLFVGNWQDLKDLFRQAGTILRADVSLGPDGRSRGFGTVSFASDTDAERAVAMFNGFDYNGRTLKVHYDKFCAQTPLPSSFSPHSSTLNTPVQPVSTQAALLQAMQLQQLMYPQNMDRYSSNSSVGHNQTNAGADFEKNAYNSSTLGASLQALHESLQVQHDSLHTQSQSQGLQTMAIGSGSGGGLLASPFSTNTYAGATSSSLAVPTTPSLAERRLKVPAPLSAPSSRPNSGGSAPGAEMSGVSLSNALANPFAHTASLPESPKHKRQADMSSLTSSSSTGIGSSTASVSSAAGSSGSATTMTATHSGHPHSMPPRPSHSATSSSASSSASPRGSHPAHPGPIALPPPPSVSAFPLFSPGHPHPHPMSPLGHPMSPVGIMYSGYYGGPMSPHPHQHPHPYPVPAHVHAAMTPHGLPPITPSMPSFSFVPQPSPVGAPGAV
ncbi:hypothetical protein EW145_g7973, partial [Phellinidium pouzarii]